MKCPKCGAELKDGTSFCSECGSIIERHCISCGQVLKADDMFCPACGARQDEEPEKAQATDTNNAQPYQLTDVDKMLNKISEIFDSKLRLTEDTYRNKLVRSVMVYYACGCAIGIYLIISIYRVYKSDGIELAIGVFIIFCIVEAIVNWIFKFDNCEKVLKKYDTIAKEVGQRDAILVTESNAVDKRTGCLVTGTLILVVLVFMSLC
jgi:uncharacterized membrane protein YvbJ